VERRAKMRRSRTVYRQLIAWLVLFLLLSLAMQPHTAHAAAFVVNDTRDRVDSSIGNGMCRTSAGTCTLRAAIQEANALAGADTIQLPRGTYTLTIAPLNGNLAETGDLDITGPLTISGAGASTTILDGGQPPAGSPPIMRGLDRLLEIHPSAGNVSLSRLTIREGYSVDSGGGIYYAGLGTLRLESARVLDSYAAKFGGGIHNIGNGRVDLVGTIVLGNGAGEGGSAINNAAGGIVDIRAGSAITNNPGTYPLGAGAIHNQAEVDAIGTISIADSTVADNAAIHNGAAIHNVGDGSLLVERATISGNSTAADGGGIYTVSGIVSITNSTIAGNQARTGGGIYNAGESTRAGPRGLVEVTDSTITGNIALESGGGIFNDLEGQLTLTKTTVSGNQAGAEGGGLSNQGHAALTISGGFFVDNAAADYGGGVVAESAWATTIDDVEFSGNAAGADGGGGLYTDGPGTIDIAGATFAGNTAIGNGGGVAIHSLGPLTIADSIIRDNTSESDGGGVENSGMLANFSRLTITNNTAMRDGGGIHNTSSGELTLLDNSIEHNTAANGGGLANRPDSTLVVRGSLFYANTARIGDADSGFGGGIYNLSDGASSIENTTISGNSAQAGGGMYHDADSTLRLINTTIWGNTAPTGSGIGLLDSDSVPTDPPTPNASVILRNTIVGGSCDAAVSSEGGNIDGGTACSFQGPRDRMNASLALDALAANRGATRTHALRADSLAVDGGVDACPEIDQRGVSRPQNAACDSGAVEFEGIPAPPGNPPAPPDPPSPPEVITNGYMAGEVLVKLHIQADLAAVAQDFGLNPTPIDQFGTRPIYRLAIGDGALPPDKAAALATDSRVAAAEPNYVGQTPEGGAKSSWAGAKSSWAGGETGEEYAAQWAPLRIRLPEAHAITRGAGVTVAVLDTGVDTAHPGLAGRLGPGYDFVNMDADAREEDPDGLSYGHGTHVAGLVALAAPDATIMPVRMLDADGNGNLWVAIEALEFAVNPDGDLQTTSDSVDIINMSFSFERESSLLEQFVREVTCDDDDQEEEDLCDASGGRGVVFVAAAGNQGTSTPEYPAAEPVVGVLSVGATTEFDLLADFSNYGGWVHVAAPGENIISSVPGNDYGIWSGTSMAAPLAAGTAALLRASEPDLSAADITSRVIDAATDIGGTVPRRIDAAVALGLPRLAPMGDLLCQGSIGAAWVSNVIVPPGASCTLNGTRIMSNVKVEPGASLSASGISVGGNLDSLNATLVALSSSVVAGSAQLKEGQAATFDHVHIAGTLQLEKNSGAIQLADTIIGGDLQAKENSGGLTLVSNDIGNAQLEKNSGTLQITGTIIGGTLLIKENTGGTTLLSNEIGANLVCEQNDPAPIGSSNQAEHAQGQCSALS
jgi:CSLREA domain-containing protein